MEAVVVVLALAVGGLLVVKSTNRDDSRRPIEWTPVPPSRQLALVREHDGTWARAGASPPPDESTLTVTLVVPWEEVGERYSGLNVVVR